MFFEVVSVDSVVASEARVKAEHPEARVEAEQPRRLDCEVEEASSMVLLSDELVCALPSSLSEAESPAAAAAAEAGGGAAADAAPPEVMEAAVRAAALGGVEGRWLSLRLRISGLSDTVLIFNFPSSSTETIRRPLSDVSNSSLLCEDERKKKQKYKDYIKYILSCCNAHSYKTLVLLEMVVLKVVCYY